MNYLHQEFDVGPDDLIEVALDGPANVMLLDPENFEFYRRREPFRYHGGHATATPFRLIVPSRGRWHLVVDLGGMAGSVRAGVRLLRTAEAAR
mgnify:CR=1 FL=1